MIMKRIRFTGFTMLLMLVLMMAGAPVHAGGSQGISRAITANPFAQRLAAAAEVWHWLVAEAPAGQNDGAGTGVLAKADSTPPSGSSSTTSGTGGIINPPGGGCIDPNGHPIPCP
jgi:hypothetical protein